MKRGTAIALGRMAVVAALVLIFFGVRSCCNSESHQTYMREQAAKERAERQPHVIREADGCKVYAFKSGDRWHYFTRCPYSQVTHDAERQVCKGAGKHRTCKIVTDTITTEESAPR